MASVYQINKGVGRPIVFKGLRAQYIAYLAIGLVVLFVVFALLFIAGISLLVVLPVIAGAGAALSFSVFRLSARFGEHGLSKFLARRQLPVYLRFTSRRVFTALKNHPYDRH